MYCKNCGADIPEGALFCGNCGMRVPEEHEQPTQSYDTESGRYEEAPRQEGPQGESGSYYEQSSSYQDNSGSYEAPNGPVYGAPYQQPYNGGENADPTLWIILSVIEIVTCCSIIPGVIGLIFGINANSKKNRGDFEGARSDVKTAKIAVLVGLGLFVLGTVVSIASGIFSALFG